MVSEWDYKERAFISYRGFKRIWRFLLIIKDKKKERRACLRFREERRTLAVPAGLLSSTNQASLVFGPRWNPKQSWILAVSRKWTTKYWHLIESSSCLCAQAPPLWNCGQTHRDTKRLLPLLLSLSFLSAFSCSLQHPFISQAKALLFYSFYF